MSHMAIYDTFHTKEHLMALDQVRNQVLDRLGKVGGVAAS